MIGQKILGHIPTTSFGILQFMKNLKNFEYLPAMICDSIDMPRTQNFQTNIDLLEFNESKTLFLKRWVSVAVRFEGRVGEP